MAGWLSDEDLNSFDEYQFMDLLEEPEQQASATDAKQISSSIADLEELSRCTETSSLSQAATSKHRKVSLKSVTIRKRPSKPTKPHSVDSDMGEKVTLAWNSANDSTKPSEEEIQLSALRTKEIGDALQEIKARVETIKGNLVSTKDFLSKLIRNER